MNEREGARLAELAALDILDTAPEAAFDDIVRVASLFCETPIALVSLVDRDRQWFKACLGLDARETPVEQAVCAIAIQQIEPLVIPDLALDPRTSDNPLVTDDPRIRFYAGAPLIMPDGVAIGTLCVIDIKPRPSGLTNGQCEGLVALARQVVVLMDMRRAVHDRDGSIVRHRMDGMESRHLARKSEAARVLLEASDTRSRTAQEAGRIGTFELDVLTNIAEVSAEFCRLYGLPLATQVSAAEVEAVILPEAETTFSTLESRTDGSADLDVEYRVRRPDDGRVRWIARRARFDRDDAGRIVRMFGTVHDVTDRRLAVERMAALLELGDMLRDADVISDIVSAATAIVGQTLACSRVGYALIDQSAGTFAVEADWAMAGNASLVGTHELARFPRTIGRLNGGQSLVVANVPSAHWLATDLVTYEAMAVRSVINVPIVVRGELAGVLFVHDSVPRTWSDLEIEFAESVADRTYAAIAQVKTAADRDVLQHELSHRLKNMLSMVQAIATQTLKTVPDRAPVQAFEQRLMALSTAHDILLKQNWSAARIDAVIDGVIDGLGQSPRIRSEGPPITLGSRASLALALLLHELTTNAMKYGALSVIGGLVSITWATEGIGDQAVLKLSWRETEGPPAIAPTRKGFGSRLISMGLLGTGGASTRYTISGFEADFTAPLARALAD